MTWGLGPPFSWCWLHFFDATLRTSRIHARFQVYRAKFARIITTIIIILVRATDGQPPLIRGRVLPLSFRSFKLPRTFSWPCLQVSCKISFSTFLDASVSSGSGPCPWRSMRQASSLTIIISLVSSTEPSLRWTPIHIAWYGCFLQILILLLFKTYKVCSGRCAMLSWASYAYTHTQCMHTCKKACDTERKEIKSYTPMWPFLLIWQSHSILGKLDSKRFSHRFAYMLQNASQWIWICWKCKKLS